MAKISLGRQKIKFEKIKIKTNLQVTFSKRRVGLFKKASELCILCGVEIAIVVFSPAGKLYCFGHPKVDSIVDRFLNYNCTRIYLMETHRIATIPDLNIQQMHMNDELEAEKKRSETLDEMRKANQNQFWWEAPIEDLNLHELEQLQNSMDELKKMISIEASIEANKLLVENSNPMSLFGTYNSNRGGVDQYELKPNTIISASSGYSHVHSYGYGHGFF